MRTSLRVAFWAATLALFATGASAQSNLPEWPANWWNDLEVGGSATYEMNAMGMVMTLTQSVEAIDGSQITVATTINMMGNSTPPQTEVIDAATLTPESQIAMMQRMGNGMPGAAGPPQDLSELEDMVTRVSDTTCEAGSRTVDCTEFELNGEGITSRAWISTSIPPVFMNGVVRSEATVQGQAMSVNLTDYSGGLLD